MRFLTSNGFSRTSKPATVALPEVGGRKQVRTRIVVVFPAPLGPRNPTICPFSTSKEMLSTATVRAYRLVRPSTLIILMCPRQNRRGRCHLGYADAPERALQRITDRTFMIRTLDYVVKRSFGTLVDWGKLETRANSV